MLIFKVYLQNFPQTQKFHLVFKTRDVESEAQHFLIFLSIVLAFCQWKQTTGGLIFCLYFFLSQWHFKTSTSKKMYCQIGVEKSDKKAMKESLNAFQYVAFNCRKNVRMVGRIKIMKIFCSTFCQVLGTGSTGNFIFWRQDSYWGIFNRNTSLFFLILHIMFQHFRRLKEREHRASKTLFLVLFNTEVLLDCLEKLSLLLDQ